MGKIKNFSINLKNLREMMRPAEEEIETQNSQPMETTKTVTTTVQVQQPSNVIEDYEPSPPPQPTIQQQPQVNNRATKSTSTVTPTTTTTTQITQTPQIKMAATTPRTFSSRMQAKVRMIPENRKEQLNTRYMATLPGVLKFAELLVGFVAFILAICANRNSTSSAWTEHITFETTLVVCVLLILYVVFPHLTLADERTREGMIVVELLFYGVNTLFFFISIWLMVHLAASWTAEGRGAAIMDAILCLALCILYAVETYIKYKAWVGHDVVPRMGSPYRVPPAPTHAEQKYEEKRFQPANSGESADDRVDV